ncbi:hypothetical protein, partial [Mesorhizobium sp. M00.F.Ca.ET.217.01.1.1]|uniref:hypothetical protein n=1 Tax=Mesorhizobium sp. M00.F.Ca.ET.217.01.1.1 TaxID=2500529 RepID=UPI001AED182C
AGNDITAFAKQSPVRMRHAQLARLPARQVGSSINDFAERSSGRALLCWQMSEAAFVRESRKLAAGVPASRRWV